MKILIITGNVGRTAPGIVFERLIQGLSSTNEIDLLTSDYDPSIDLSKLSNTIIYEKKNIHPRINKLFLILFGVNPFDCFWAWKAIRKIKKEEATKYDLVFSFLSFQHYAALIAGVYFSKKHNKKLAVYSVDAIPAPIGWLNYDSYYKGLKKMIAKYLREVDAFFSSNSQMLSYQLTTFLPKKNILTEVVYNPSYGEFKIFPKNNERTNRFVYTGGIYGVRKADYLLEGFEKLLKIYPDSKLVFVGTQSASVSVLNLEPETIKKIEIVPFTKDLSEYYNNATALIDIDADLENDVFLSSKMTNYLLINKAIISETGVNSPSRHLFKNIESIMQCDHDSDQICEAMKKAITTKYSIDFNDRIEIIELFNLESIVSRLNDKIEQLRNLKC